jgi:hypothetical protein
MKSTQSLDDLFMARARKKEAKEHFEDPNVA